MCFPCQSQKVFVVFPSNFDPSKVKVNKVKVNKGVCVSSACVGLGVHTAAEKNN